MFTSWSKCHGNRISGFDITRSVLSNFNEKYFPQSSKDQHGIVPLSTFNIAKKEFHERCFPLNLIVLDFGSVTLFSLCLHVTPEEGIGQVRSLHCTRCAFF